MGRVGAGCGAFWRIWKGNCVSTPSKAILVDLRTCLYAAKAISIPVDWRCSVEVMSLPFFDTETGKYFYAEVDPAEYEILTPTSSLENLWADHRATLPPSDLMATTQISLPLPVLPQGWTGDNDFKAIGSLSAATQRNLEPVGPHFLAHARRV